MENPKIVKSLVRVLGYLILYGVPSNFAIAAATVLIASELIGIYESLTEKKAAH